MSAWLLPDHIADVLPPEAQRIERLRRLLLDTARSYGYELVIPPLVEYLQSLLTGTGEVLDLQTFKLVDQISGRTLGLRADTTPQVARIDAHMLARQGVARLCYCGPVLHTRPERVHANREPLQMGAEIYGVAAREADLEVLSLALDCLRAARVPQLNVDLGDARIVAALLATAPGAPVSMASVQNALSAKNPDALAQATGSLPPALQDDLASLIDLYGDIDVLDRAEQRLGHHPEVCTALADLRWLARHLDGVSVGFDLAEGRGWGYYTGARFSIYVEGAGDALLRGGRYDGVGAIFARNPGKGRPAAGFSVDLRELVRVTGLNSRPTAICAPWSEDAGLSRCIARLRAQGEIVVQVFRDHEAEVGQLHCDRMLVRVDDGWQVVARAAHTPN